MEMMIKKIVTCHFKHCPYIQHRVKNKDQTPVLPIFENRGLPITSTAVSEYNLVLWSHFASLLAPMIKPLFVFFTSIPTFVYVNWDDRLQCLKSRFFEVWIIQVSNLVSCREGIVTFSNGYFISKDQLEIMYDEDFVRQLFDFFGCLRDLRLSDSALVLYSAVVLYSEGETSLKRPYILPRIQEKYKIYLSYQLHVLDKQAGAFDVLISMLPVLQDIGKKHRYYVKKFCTDNFPYTNEPLLLADVFNSTDRDDIIFLAKQTWEETTEELAAIS